MARTPGIFSAAAVSSLTTLPLAMVASTGTAYSSPGKWKSEVYFAVPVTFSGPSTRGVARPMGERAGASCVGGMVPPSQKSNCRSGLEGVGKAALGQFDLEAILTLRLGVAQGRLRRLAEVIRRDSLAGQDSLGFRGAPWLGAHAAQGDADPAHFSTVEADHNSGGRQGKLVGRAAAQLQVVLLASRHGRRQGHVVDQVA